MLAESTTKGLQSGKHHIPVELIDQGEKGTVFTQSIGTDRPEQTVDPDQMPLNAASDQGLHSLAVLAT